jgi:Domain of unknown function (DUF4276)
MNGEPAEAEWSYGKFGLWVTGKAEEKFMPSFLRALTSDHGCGFRVVRRIPQRSPRTSKKRRLSVVGTDKKIPTLDVEEIGLPVRNFLRDNPNSFAILVDDLEHGRRDLQQEIYERYRAAVDSVIPKHLRGRVSVHFLVYMLEAYYLAHAEAVNKALGSDLKDHSGDVEEIRNPKGQLKAIKPDFDEVADGKRIVALLDLDHVLKDPNTCASLRTLVKWCILARQVPLTDRFQALTGACSAVTGGQAPVVNS